MPRLTPVLRVCLLALLVVTVVVGCGPPGPKVYDTAKTRACLEKAGQVGPPPSSDIVASTALGGSFAVKLPHNSVTIAFGDTVATGDNIDQAYRRFRARNVGIDDVLRQQGNAVMLWHVHPEDADLSLVQGCLKT